MEDLDGGDNDSDHGKRSMSGQNGGFNRLDKTSRTDQIMQVIDNTGGVRRRVAEIEKSGSNDQTPGTSNEVGGCVGGKGVARVSDVKLGGEGEGMDVNLRQPCIAILREPKSTPIGSNSIGVMDNLFEVTVDGMMDGSCTGSDSSIVKGMVAKKGKWKRWAREGGQRVTGPVDEDILGGKREGIEESREGTKKLKTGDAFDLESIEISASREGAPACRTQ